MTSPDNSLRTDAFADDSEQGGHHTGVAAPYSGGLRRHETDAVSLMGGLFLVLVAAAVLLTDVTELSVDGRWVIPVVLLVVGAAGLLSTLRPARAEGSVRD